MKNTLYRKLLYVISMVLLSLVAVLLFRTEEGIFRMHVIANSITIMIEAAKSSASIENLFRRFGRSGEGFLILF